MASEPSAKGPSLLIGTALRRGLDSAQVTMADFAGWQQALSGQPGVTLKSYPALNHLFLPGEGPSTPAEYSQPAHVPAEVIDDIGAWLKALP